MELREAFLSNRWYRSIQIKSTKRILKKEPRKTYRIKLRKPEKIDDF